MISITELNRIKAEQEGIVAMRREGEAKIADLNAQGKNYKHHVLWLANKYLKRKVRTNAEKFNELVDLCVMCDSLIVNNASDSIRDKRLADYKFPTDLKLEIYKYIKEIMVNRNGTEIIPLDEKLVTAL